MPLDNNPDNLKAIWDSMPEPLRATILSAVLGILLALRAGDGRTWTRKLLDVGVCAVTGYIVGYALHMAEFKPEVIWGANAAIAYMGVDKVKSVVDKVVDSLVDTFATKKRVE
jgi:lambda family phage holin